MDSPMSISDIDSVISSSEEVSSTSSSSSSSDINNNKLCRKCGVVKPISEFNKNSKSKDKLQCYCKECNKDICRKFNANRNNVLKFVITSKIHNYLSADRNSGRLSRDYKRDKYYVDHKWIENALVICNYKCHYCCDTLIVEGFEGHNNKQFTLDRIDNKLPHYKSNCVIACLECNVKRNNKEYIEFCNEIKLRR